MKTLSNLLKACGIFVAFGISTISAMASAEMAKLWENPDITCKPHTRWWWPGNAVTKEGIDFQLEEMHKNGIGGVEIMSYIEIFTRGNIPFASDDFFKMVRHAVQKAKSLGMTVTISFGPGWNFGNAFVQPKDGMRCLVIDNLGEFEGVISLPELGKKINSALPYANLRPKRLELLIAEKINATTDETFVLTEKVKGDNSDFASSPSLSIDEPLPAGKWRITAYWKLLTEQACVLPSKSFDGSKITQKTTLVNHFDHDAVKKMSDKMFSLYDKYIGKEFGKTVDCVFNDSFELTHDDFYWFDGFFEYFSKIKGYDLRWRFAEMIEGKSNDAPLLRYDFNHILHLKGIEGIIDTMQAECARRGMDMRQQPHYRFPPELMEAAGRYTRPETELNVRIFDPKFYPHKLTSSAVRLYGGKWTSSETFTFNAGKYKTTLSEMKRSVDGFLRDNVTQFYNHGYFYTPEKSLSAARDFFWMNRISHVNPWWHFYKHLAEYTARAASICRNGKFKSDILIYTPNDTVWSEDIFFKVSHIRDVPCGELPLFLVANGYDFDAINNDLILKSKIKDGKILINGYDYSVIFLPRAIFMPLCVLEKLKEFVAHGGIVIALDRLPTRPTGLKDSTENTRKIENIVSEIFNLEGSVKNFGKGKTFYAPEVKGFNYIEKWDPNSKEYAPIEFRQDWINVEKFLKANLTPDFEFASGKHSQGLTFYHNSYGDIDSYFITNLSPNIVDEYIIFNSKGKVPEIWDAMTGEIKPLYRYEILKDGRVKVRIKLNEWQSCFIVLSPAPETPQIRADNLCEILEAKEDSVRAITDKNGSFFADLKYKDKTSRLKAETKKLPNPIEIVGNPWTLSLESIKGERIEKKLDELKLWNEIRGLKNFSGQGIYTTNFTLPESFFPKGEKIGCILDLGKVYVCAKVFINGTEVGDAWMEPYVLEIPEGLLKVGENKLEIRLVNLLWNYAAGLKAPEALPSELHEYYGGGNHNSSKVFEKLTQSLKRNKDLMPSGLLGPVKIYPQIEIELK